MVPLKRETGMGAGSSNGAPEVVTSVRDNSKDSSGFWSLQPPTTYKELCRYLEPAKNVAITLGLIAYLAQMYLLWTDKATLTSWGGWVLAAAGLSLWGIGAYLNDLVRQRVLFSLHAEYLTLALQGGIFLYSTIGLVSSLTTSI